ncbi:hypothetical protein C8Q77DRAFT_1127810 [Trametes polyzona]|nr:hypothetical protein C8Q77DRAFT_1127810 [Trametes polyzona]
MSSDANAKEPCAASPSIPPSRPSYTPRTSVICSRQQATTPSHSRPSRSSVPSRPSPPQVSSPAIAIIPDSANAARRHPDVPRRGRPRPARSPPAHSSYRTRRTPCLRPHNVYEPHRRVRPRSDSPSRTSPSRHAPPRPRPRPRSSPNVARARVGVGGTAADTGMRDAERAGEKPYRGSANFEPRTEECSRTRYALQTPVRQYVRA